MQIELGRFKIGSEKFREKGQFVNFRCPRYIKEEPKIELLERKLFEVLNTIGNPVIFLYFRPWNGQFRNSTNVQYFGIKISSVRS